MMGFKNWLKERLKRDEREEVRVNSQDPNILCDEYTENLISKWLKDAQLEPDGLSEFLKAIGFMMPIKLTNLKLWERTSVRCTDAIGKKYELVFEHQRHLQEKQQLIILNGETSLDYTTEDICWILKSFVN